MNNYLIAVGGTGQHLALALLDYLGLSWHASSETGGFPETEAWRIILLDADQEAADGAESAWSLARAQAERLRAAGLQVFVDAKAPVEQPDGLFAQPTPKMVAGRDLAPEAAGALLPLLFTRRQLALNMNQGYWGEPRVAAFFGARWLKRALSDPRHELRAIQDAILAAPANVRLAIAGSIAGGTGAGLIEPLRQWASSLATTAGVPQHVMISVGMEWFRVSGESRAELSTRMRHNASSCLLPFLARPEAHVFNVWAHPAVDTTREEEDGKDKAQPAKQNLTIPWFAATNLASFFSAVPPDHTRFSNAAKGDTVRVIRSEQHDVPQLVESNREMVGRLRLAADYLDKPWDGWAFPMFSSIGRVARLDDVDRKIELKKRFRSAADAKEVALQRLGASESRNSKSLSVDALPQRSLLKLKNFSKTASLQDYSYPVDASPKGQDTTSRLLPGYTLAILNDGAVPAAGAPAGARVPLTDALVQALADQNAIAITRVPRLDAVQMLMDQFLLHRDGWPETLIARDGKPHPVRPLVTPTDDHTVEWIRRWFLVLRALLNGKLTRADFQASASIAAELRVAGVDVSEDLVARDVLMFDTGAERYAVGFLSPRYAVLPAVGGIWSELAAIDVLTQRASGLRLVASWCAALRRYLAGPAPAWVEYVFSQMSGDLIDDDVAASDESIFVLWRDSKRAVPLPADEGRPIYLYIDADVPTQRRDEYAARLRNLEIAGAGSPRYVRSELEREFRREFTGQSIAGVVPIPPADILTEETVFSDEMLQLSDGRFAIPIRVSMLCHVNSWQMSRRGSNVRVTIVLRGKVEGYAPTLSREYSTTPANAWTPRIRREAELATSLLVWPKSRPASAANTGGQPVSSILIGGKCVGQQKREAVVLWSAGDWTSQETAEGTSGLVPEAVATSDWLDLVSRARLTRVEALQPMTNCRAVAFRHNLNSPTAPPVEVGVILSESKIYPVGADAERWAVDYGTSSTVVAWRTALGADILHLSGKHDNTVPLLNQEPVAANELAWFPTWDGKSPRTTTIPGEMGSHLLVIDAAGPGSELGRHYVNDFAWTISPSNSRDYRVRYTKWGNDPLRSAFNRNVLELALAARLSSAKGLPAQIEVVFTVPYRQRADIQSFARAVDEAVRAIRNDFGVEIKPRFLWESHALRPPKEVMKSGVFVAADLGGGSLDLYAARYVQEDGVARIADQVIDSARIGADVLVYAWANDDVFPELVAADTNPVNKTAIIKSKVRGNDIATDAWRRATETQRAREYWKALRLYIDHWTRAVLEYWKVLGATPVHIERFGLGWTLFDRDPLGGISWIDILNQSSAVRGGSVQYEQVVSSRDGRSGKEELAYRAVRRPAAETFASVDDLVGAPAKLLLGVACRSGNVSSPAGSVLSDFRPIPGGVDFQDADSLSGDLGVSRPRLNEALGAMNNHGHDSALLDLGDIGQRLVISPLTLAVEQLVLEKVGPLPQVVPA